MKIKKRIVVLDVETTGFEYLVDEVTELGVVVLDGMTGEEVSVFNSIFKIKADKISEDNIKVTGITKEMTDTGNDLSVGIDYLKGVVDDDTIVVAHNAPFDFGFLAHHFNVEPKYFIDTLTLSRVTQKEFKSHKLGDIAERNGIELVDAHRALNDARATVEVLKMFFNDENRDKSKALINVLDPGFYPLKYRPKHTKKVIGE